MLVERQTKRNQDGLLVCGRWPPYFGTPGSLAAVFSPATVTCCRLFVSVKEQQFCYLRVRVHVFCLRGKPKKRRHVLSVFVEGGKLPISAQTHVKFQPRKPKRKNNRTPPPHPPSVRVVRVATAPAVGQRSMSQSPCPRPPNSLRLSF